MVGKINCYKPKGSNGEENQVRTGPKHWGGKRVLLSRGPAVWGARDSNLFILTFLLRE